MDLVACNLILVVFVIPNLIVWIKPVVCFLSCSIVRVDSSEFGEVAMGQISPSLVEYWWVKFANWLHISRYVCLHNEYLHILSLLLISLLRNLQILLAMCKVLILLWFLIGGRNLSRLLLCEQSRMCSIYHGIYPEMVIIVGLLYI